MSFNGSGTFNLVSGNPVVTGTTISSTWANNTLSDIATGLSNCITRDGQSLPLANLPMGNYKITGLAAATATGDALSYGNAATVTNLTASADALIHGLTVGLGGGSVAGNTAVGYATLPGNTTGVVNSAVGYAALNANTTGSYNSAFGWAALYSNTTASNNTAVGSHAGYNNTTGSITAVGYYALNNNTTGNYNTAVGQSAGYSTTGSSNTFIGQGAGYYVTTGSKNTILGSYTGNQGGLDIRTASNYIVLSDGDGNPRGIFDNGGNLLVGQTSTPDVAKLAITQTTAYNSGTYNLTTMKAASAATYDQLQSTSVSTTATVILSSGLYASFMIVFGSDGTNRFIDLVLAGLGNGTVTVVSSHSVSGTPAARTYSQSSSTYRLAMASGTYTIQVRAISLTG